MVQMVSEPGSFDFIEPLKSVVTIVSFYTRRTIDLRMICQSEALFTGFTQRLNEIFPLID